MKAAKHSKYQIIFNHLNIDGLKRRALYREVVDINFLAASAFVCLEV
jgi:hypothetical protein